MTVCDHEGCDNQAVITLEVIEGREDGVVSHFCLAHAEQVEEQAEKRHAVTRRQHVEPAVGMPCTFRVGSDCYPGKVIEVRGPKRIVVQRVHYTADKAGGHNYFGSQKWTIHFDQPEGEPKVYTLRGNGRWAQVGVEAKYADLGLGHARAYSDPHF